MWIGFYNISRSVATASPALNTWDDRGSEIWINNKKIMPPIWTRPGGKGDLERPLTDEGYEYRPPAVVHLQKGCNRLLVKLSVGSFRSARDQNPVKWMFTTAFVKPLGRNFITNDGLINEDSKQQIRFNIA